MHFHLFSVDLIGMGSSSRPEFSCNTCEEADDHMIHYLEKWRIAIGNLTDFTIVGHSYGAYLAGTYAQKYP